MSGIDEAGEALGLAEAPGGGEEADRLVAPGGIERMFRDGQQFEMGEAHVDGIGDQPVAEFVPGEEAATIGAVAAHPGPEVHLIGRHRLAVLCAIGAGLQVEVVAPGEMADTGDDGGGGGAQFRAEAEGVGLQRQQMAVAADDLVFIDHALADIGDEDLPQAGIDALAHLVATAVPGVEVADDGDAPGIGGPDGEMYAADVFMDGDMGAEPVVELAVGAFEQEVIIHRAKDRAEGIGVAQGPAGVGVGSPQAVAEWQLTALGEAFEEAFGVPADQRQRRQAILRHDLDVRRSGHQRPDPQAALAGLGAEQGEWISVVGRDQSLDLGRRR